MEMAKLLRINMTDRSMTLQDLPEAYKLLGGRGLTSTLLYDEMDPTCQALGPNNKLIFAPGMLTGTAAPTSARISVGTKSPLTGTIKESNAGTGLAPALASMGIRGLVVEGQPPEKGKYWILHLSWDEGKGEPKAEFLPAGKYLGRNLYKVFPKLFERFGKVDIAGIGAAGEFRYGNAGIVFNDLEGRPARYAGRGGTGAVMGSKGLKFIIIDRAGAPGVPVADKALLDQGRKKLTEALMAAAITKPKGALNQYGTAVLINIMNEAGGLPTRNFSSGRFEGAPKIAGEAIFDGNKERLGKELYNHACSPGCIIRCSNVWHKPDGSEHVSCVEYESIWALGANCGIDDLDIGAELVRLCNAYGLDTIETGTTLAVAMEGGLAEFGDGEAAIRLLREMGKGSPVGRILGAGTDLCARTLGVVRSPTVKGQSMPAYEPRAVKGIGITYATSTMGADHTAGYTISPEILDVSDSLDPLSPEGKAAVSRAFQTTTAWATDTTGHCLFITFAMDEPTFFEGLMDEVNGVLGTQYTAADITRLGAEILRKERAFNEAAGFGKVHDRLPEYMRYEKLPPHDEVWNVPDEALDAVYGDL
jgi:aldehyde:ferredoxin oxidoreductase